MQNRWTINMNKLMKAILFLLIIGPVSAQDITDGCDLPDDPYTGYLHLTSNGSVLYKSPYAIGGFQFNVEGATISSASGGDAAGAGLLIQTMGDLILAFSLSGSTIPAGCGTLVELTLDGDATGLSDLVIADAIGGQLIFEYYVGDDTELVADCSDEYPDCAANEFDCAGECGGSAVID